MNNKERMINIAQIMIPKISTAYVRENNTVRQGLEIFRKHGYTAIPVIDEEGNYKGSVTEGDFLWHMVRIGTVDKKELEDYKIKEIYRPDFCKALPIFANEKDVIEVSLKQNFIPIVDDRGFFCGIVTRQALIRYMSEERE